MDALAGLDIAQVQADNPGPFTLQGTNTWLVGRDPCWVVDPGPALDAHVDAVLADAADRGGIGGIAVTHDHDDHVAATAELRRRAGDPPVAGARFAGADVRLGDGDAFGPLRAIATPGHAPDHLAFVAQRALFSGDAVLGRRQRLRVARSRRAARLPGRARAAAPGSTSPSSAPATARSCWIPPPSSPSTSTTAATASDGSSHALEQGRRGVEELLDAAWSDVPSALRPAAAVTLAAHLDKLAEEGRLPAGVERPAVPRLQA